MYTIKNICFTYANLYNNNYYNKYIIKKYKNTYNTKNNKTNTIKPILQFKSLTTSDYDYDYDKYKLSKIVNNTNCQTISITPPMPPPCSIL